MTALTCDVISICYVDENHPPAARVVSNPDRLDIVASVPRKKTQPVLVDKGTLLGRFAIGSMCRPDHPISKRKTSQNIQFAGRVV